VVNADDNDLLTRVEGAAPMGRLLRENYWVPAVLSESLQAGGKPHRVHLIGRRYVVFRGHSGATGCFDEGCPHRGASLALGRNEDDALRCIYHGWKFDVQGRCVAIPTQVGDEQAACARVKINRHPTPEAAGIVWVWIGGGEPLPFPEYEFAGLPPGHFVPVRQKLAYNWVQGVEGTMDSAHVTVLHEEWLSLLSQGRGGVSKAGHQKAPRYDIDEQPYGFRYAAHREVDGEKTYSRVNVFIMPWFGMICPGDAPDGDRTAIFAVPCDDTSNVHWMVRYNPDKPVTSYYFTRHSDPNDWPPLPPGGPEENWGQDRELMRRGGLTGFTNVTTEDFAVNLSQGPIADRTREKLNTGDLAIVKLRQQLLAAARSVQGSEGRWAPAAASCRDARPFADVLDKGANWREAHGATAVR
jgi:phenylpropionate dioxygenase-like ring-hydroxylating dioxygenase large terminal subunit